MKVRRLLCLDCGLGAVSESSSALLLLSWLSSRSGKRSGVVFLAAACVAAPLAAAGVAEEGEDTKDVSKGVRDFKVGTFGSDLEYELKRGRAPLLWGGMM